MIGVAKCNVVKAPDKIVTDMDRAFAAAGPVQNEVYG
jgi:hypothetical protein